MRNWLFVYFLPLNVLIVNYDEKLVIVTSRIFAEDCSPGTRPRFSIAAGS